MGANDASLVSYASIWSRWFSSKVALFVSGAHLQELDGCAPGYVNLHLDFLRNPANLWLSHQRSIDESVLLLRTPSPESIVGQGIKLHPTFEDGGVVLVPNSSPFASQDWVQRVHRLQVRTKLTSQRGFHNALSQGRTCGYVLS